MTTPQPVPATEPLRLTGRPVRLHSLSKRYGGVSAVDDVSLDIRAGELLTLLGASGSGKTTTLSMIAGLYQTDVGSRHDRRGRCHTCSGASTDIGMVFQHYSLFPHMNVRSNVEFPLRQRRVPAAQRRSLALKALEVVELPHRAGARPSELSGGQQQRVALARALVFSPTVLLMDEPFGALDRALREKMQIEVRRIHRELGVTIVFVTHDQQEALSMSDRIAVFDSGRIAQVGTPAQLYETPANLHVATFLGESNVFIGRSAAGVFTTGGGLKLAAPLANDTHTRLVVRPERINIRHATGPAERLSGAVSEVVYVGADRRITVATPEGEITIRMPAAAAPFRVGETVALSWPNDAATTFTA